MRRGAATKVQTRLEHGTWIVNHRPSLYLLYVFCEAGNRGRNQSSKAKLVVQITCEY